MLVLGSLYLNSSSQYKSFSICHFKRPKLSQYLATVSYISTSEPDGFPLYGAIVEHYVSHDQPGLGTDLIDSTSLH